MQQPASPSRAFRINLWLHRWTSLIATPFFLVLCLTGTVLIFHEEIDAAMGYVPSATASVHERPLADSVAAVQAQFPDDRVSTIGYDPAEHPGVLLAFLTPKSDKGFERGHAVYVETASARVLPGAGAQQTPTEFLFELHAEWFLGPAGELIGALIALLVLTSIVSGVVIYAPYVKRAAFGVLRRGRGKRLLQLDLHNFFGIVVLGWLIVVTATGFLLGFGTLARGLWQNTELKALATQLDTGRRVDRERPPLSVDAALKAAEGAQPGWRATSLVFPDTDLSTPQHYTVLLFGEKGVRERLFRIAMVEADTGKVADVRDLPAYLQAVQVSQPLHFGDYGGLALKLLWIACSWLALFITGNGAWLWWARRRRTKVSAGVSELAT